MNAHSSIVKSLNFRSIAEQLLRLNVTHNLIMENNLCWDTIIKSKCYKKCIVKRIKTFRKYEFISSIRRGGNSMGSACVVIVPSLL